jgi:hypothetical protein
VCVGVGQHAPPVLHDAEFRLLGNDSEVALQRHRHADPDSVAVDRRDDRLAALPRMERVERIGRERFLRGCGERAGALREVGACTERSSRTGDHDDPDRVVGIGVAECSREGGAHLARERIHRLGPVEGDDEHAGIVAFDQDGVG